MGVWLLWCSGLVWSVVHGGGMSTLVCVASLVNNAWDVWLVLSNLWWMRLRTTVLW